MGNYCNNCGKCCKLIPVDASKRVLLRDDIQSLENDFLSSLIPISMEEANSIDSIYVENIKSIYPQALFYSCNWLSEDLHCTNPNKPDICVKYPSFPLVILPEDCGYYGEIFAKSEEIKQKIRKYKEEIVYYESIINTGTKEKKVYRKIVDSLNRFIEKYSKYGSYDW